MELHSAYRLLRVKCMEFFLVIAASMTDENIRGINLGGLAVFSGGNAEGINISGIAAVE